jgi:hypothetical protein
MAFKNKKPRESIKDPVIKFGEQLRKNKTARKKNQKNSKLLEKLARGGCDNGFVYYED